MTLHQGSTEFLLAMGLEDKMVGSASADGPIWPRYAEAPITTAVLEVHTLVAVLTMAVITMAELTLAVLTLAVPLTAYRLLNTCRPTARSRSSPSRTLQRVDMVAALGDSSAPHPSLPHSRPRALFFSSKAAAPSPLQPPYSPLPTPTSQPVEGRPRD